MTGVPAVLAAALWWTFLSDPPCESAGVEAVIVGLASLKRVLARADLWLVATLFLRHNFVLYTWVGWMPDFPTSVGASAKAAGWITSATLWTGMPSAILLSRFSARLHTRKLFLWVPSILPMLLSLLLLVIRPSIAWPVMLLAGAATSIRFNTILALPVEMVSAEQSASASGIVVIVGYMGALAGPLLAGFMLDSGGAKAGCSCPSPLPQRLRQPSLWLPPKRAEDCRGRNRLLV